MKLNKTQEKIIQQARRNRGIVGIELWSTYSHTQRRATLHNKRKWDQAMKLVEAGIMEWNGRQGFILKKEVADAG